ncbi:MAG: 50S ribosomal protein L9 [Acidimicrobiia bacterium]|nr:50S ribosomal protein L9 [Acidimicrobiia bacterium]
MRLILTDDVPNLGAAGEVVDVADGYGRNFLLPRSKAVRVTPGAVRQAEKSRVAREAANKVAKEEAERIATQLVGTRVVLAAQTGDEGKLYGSISVNDVLTGIQKFTGVELERHQIEISEAIRSIGLHEIRVKLHPEVVFPVTLDIIPA